MAFCSKCGTQVADGVKFCPNCGNDVSGGNNAQQANYNQPNMNQTNYNPAGPAKSVFDTPDSTGLFHPQDISSNKVMAVLAYLGLLWLVPFFAAKQSAFARYHVKQGFLVVCAQVGYEIIAFILVCLIKTEVTLYGIPTGIYHTPGFLVFILWIFRVIIWIMAVIGIVNAATGKAKELPFIGKFADKFGFLN